MKKFLAILLAFVMLFSLTACGGEEESAATEAAPVATEAAPAATEAAPAATEAAPVATEAATEAEPEEEMSDEDTVDLVLSLIELSIGDNFDYYTLDGDESSIELSVATDGIAEAVYEAMSVGLDENYEDWVSVKDNFCSLCDTLYESAVDLGMDDPTVFVHILNDQNYDNILLSVMNGVVVYDVMAE